ncbi:MAG: histone deacetylase [Chloroflexi bacterium]|nr:histone deacetylase [Chloroflexota bacterium]
MEDIVFFYPSGHQAHNQPGHPERPDRVEAIREELENAGLWQAYPHLAPETIPDEVLHAIHEPGYLEMIKSSGAHSQPLDMDTYLTPQTWQLAYNAAGGAIAVAGAVWRREAKRGFALTRPPGHHATPNRAMGFCLINNIAVAAEYLLQKENAKHLTIIDIDLHHGNGTQDIFWQRGDVSFFSTHQSPLYPGTGALQETGEGAGEGFTVNLPLPPYSGDKAMKAAHMTIILPLLDRFQPDMILVSAGFDAHWRDPLSQLLVSTNCYGQLITGLVNWADRHCQGRIALILEGGYDLEAGSYSALAAVQALLEQTWQDPLGSGIESEEQVWQTTLDQARQIWGL